MTAAPELMPTIADPIAFQAACQRANRLYRNERLRSIARHIAGTHERAVDYLVQAPALVFFVLGDPDLHYVAALRVQAALRFVDLCDRGASLRDVLASFSLPKPLRGLRGQALLPVDRSAIRALADAPPSLLTQTIPISIADQRRWLAAWAQWFWHVHGNRRELNLWAMRQLALHKVKAQDLSTVVDLLRFEQLPPGATWPSAVARAERWHERLGAADASRLYGAKADELICAGRQPDEVQIESHDFIALRTPAALHVEGKLMRHCVASYVERVRSGHAAIVAIRRGAQPVATAEFGVGGYLVQVKGKCNSAVAPEVRAAARDYGKQFKRQLGPADLL